MLALKYAKALADETRLRLLLVLNRFELNVNEIVAATAMSQSRISRHLKILAESGLVSYRRDGRWAFYRAARKDPAQAFILAVEALARSEPGLEADIDQAERIVAQRAIQTTRFFNSVAEDWDRMRREALGGFDVTGKIMALMSRCMVAVDLGCGTGELLKALKIKAQKVIGVDNSPKMLRLAQKNLVPGQEDPDDQGISLRIGDLEHLPLRDQEADFAVMSLSLHHLSSPLDGIREAFRVLTPGGAFVLADFDKHALETMRSRFGDLWLGFDRDEISGWLAQTGFSLEQTTGHALPDGLGLRIYQALKTTSEEKK